MNKTRLPHAPENPLICAIQRGSLAVVKALVRGGANVNEKSPTWGLAAPLDLAVLYKHLDIAKFLLENGAKPSDTVLYCAVYWNQPDFARLLIEYGAGSDSALALAAARGFREVVAAFVETDGCIGASQARDAADAARKNGHGAIASLLSAQAAVLEAKQDYDRLWFWQVEDKRRARARWDSLLMQMQIAFWRLTEPPQAQAGPAVRARSTG